MQTANGDIVIAADSADNRIPKRGQPLDIDQYALRGDISSQDHSNNANISGVNSAATAAVLDDFGGDSSDSEGNSSDSNEFGDSAIIPLNRSISCLFSGFFNCKTR